MSVHFGFSLFTFLSCTCLNVENLCVWLFTRSHRVRRFYDFNLAMFTLHVYWDSLLYQCLCWHLFTRQVDTACFPYFVVPLYGFTCLRFTGTFFFVAVSNNCSLTQCCCSRGSYLHTWIEWSLTLLVFESDALFTYAPFPYSGSPFPLTVFPFGPPAYICPCHTGI